MMVAKQLEIKEANGGTRPIPDPTVLTTQLIDRAIDGLRDILQTRLAGMDKAIELLQRTIDQYPALRHEAVDRLQELHSEKFASIETQFMERDTRTEQTSRDNKVAIDAALQAQKEAVAKSEVGFTKQIDNITTLIATQAKGADDKLDGLKTLIAAQAKSADEKIDDLKTRLAANDGRSKGIGDFMGYIVGGVGLLLTLIMLVFVILKYTSGNGVTG